MRTQTWPWPVLVLLPFFFPGCKGQTEPLLPVNGKVTYRGQWVQNGTIVFTPDSARGNNGPLAMGEIKADGTYSLRTGESQGVAPGWYRVTVAAVVSDGGAIAGQGYRIPTSLLPEKYRDPELSRLVCEVKSNGANTVDFDLQ